MVAVSLVKTEDEKVSCETPEGTVVNININQRSCMDSIVEAMKTIRIVKKVEAEKKPAKKTGSGVLVGVGASFVSLGCISVMLAIILRFVWPEMIMVYLGTHFWMGFPFLVCGLLNIVAYKYPKALWEVLAFISLMGSLAVSIAGMVFVVYDINTFEWRNNLSSRCRNILDIRTNSYGYEDRYYYGYRTTQPPRYYDPSSDWRMQECQRGFEQYKNLLHGVLILSLLMTIWGLCLSAIILGYRVKQMFSICKCERVQGENEDKDEPMLIPNPVGDVFIA